MAVTAHGRMAPVAVGALKPGQQVWTLDGGRPVLTRVLQNERRSGRFTFVELTAARGSEVFNLTVTEGHNMARARKVAASGPNLTGKVPEAGELAWELSLAQDLRVGDAIPVLAQPSFAGAAPQRLAPVVAVRTSQQDAKNVLITKAGTVVANGVLTTTICDGRESAYNKSSFTGAMAQWRRAHAELHATLPML